jgi:acyl-CoA thioesterase
LRKRDPPRLTELAKILGMQITRFEDGNCTVELTVGVQHLNMAGVAHGGVHATLLDTSMGGTLVSIIEEEEWCATAQLDISYLNAVKEGASLIATSKVVRRGRHIAHVEGMLDTADGTRVASAKGTWAIWEKRPKNRRG